MKGDADYCLAHHQLGSK